MGESVSQVEEKVEQLIKATGLSSCKDTKVGNLLLRGYVVCPFYSPSPLLPFLIFALRSEKTRRLSIQAIK